MAALTVHRATPDAIAGPSSRWHAGRRRLISTINATQPESAANPSHSVGVGDMIMAPVYP